jgi:actin-related protein 3
MLPPRRGGRAVVEVVRGKDAKLRLVRRYTKMGYAGNAEPSFIVPTAIATKDGVAAGDHRATGSAMEDLDFFIGDDALSMATTHAVNYPIRHGLIENWDSMERLWQRCMFDYLRCEPEEHAVVLTEPPLNPPENREYAAEVMFETYNVPALYIAVQAVLALVASWTVKDASSRSLTGTVIDSGDGVTHVIPVADGYVIGSCIKHIPLAGHDITKFVLNQMRERSEPVPPEISADIARRIKERNCYVCKDLAREFRRFDTTPSKCFTTYEGVHPRTKKPWVADVGYEQFLGPELFFNPEVYTSQFTKPLPQVVDEAILASPIDTRRALYGNIVLSGGSTMFRNFDRRVQMDVQQIVDDRIEANRSAMAARGLSTSAVSLPVNVVAHPFQRYAVWFGGSMLSSMPGFERICHTKAQYEEEGPRIARHNAVFGATL